MNKLLILGGTGFVGRHLSARPGLAGWQLSVPTRQPGAVARPGAGSPVELVQADVHDEATLTQLMESQDAVVNLVAILHGTAATFDQVHVELPKKIARACAAAGVRRLVHVSALGASQDGPSMYQRSKARGEAVLQAAATAGSLDLTVLRPSVIFGADDQFLNVFAQLQRVFPVIPLAGADTRFQPVWVDDVAAAIVRCLENPSTIGQTYEAAGPEVCTLGEIVRWAGRWAGIREGAGRPVWPLPEALGRLQARMMELAPGEPLMSRDNLDSMRVDNVATGALPGLDALGITPAALATLAPGYLRRR